MTRTSHRRVVLASYGLTLARGLGVTALIALLFALIVLPAATSGLSGGEGGASIGCLAVAAACGAVLALYARRPDWPGAIPLTLMSRQLAAGFLIFAPMGPAIELIADRGAAVAVAVPIGIGLLLGCWWAFHRYIELPARRAGES